MAQELGHLRRVKGGEMVTGAGSCKALRIDLIKGADCVSSVSMTKLMKIHSDGERGAREEDESSSSGGDGSSVTIGGSGVCDKGGMAARWPIGRRWRSETICFSTPVHLSGTAGVELANGAHIA